MTFEQWMDRLDEIVSKALGLSTQCMSDRNFRDAFEDGSSPEEAAQDFYGIDSDSGEVDWDLLYSLD